MFNVERKNTIATWLLERGRVNVAALAEALGVTKETIRRDLNELEKEGVAQRTHGGAVLAKGHEDSFGDLRYGLRQRFNVPGKKAIGGRRPSWCIRAIRFFWMLPARACIWGRRFAAKRA